MWCATQNEATLKHAGAVDGRTRGRRRLTAANFLPATAASTVKTMVKHEAAQRCEGEAELFFMGEFHPNYRRRRMMLRTVSSGWSPRSGSRQALKKSTSGPLRLPPLVEYPTSCPKLTQRSITV